jgi:hypothetical protein
MIASLDTNAVIWLSDGCRRPSSLETIRLIDLAELLVSPLVVLELESLDEIRRSKQSARDVETIIEHELGIHVCGLPCGGLANRAHDQRRARIQLDRMIVAQAKGSGLGDSIPSGQVIASRCAQTTWQQTTWQQTTWQRTTWQRISPE